jgi:uncharacterized protein YebE (UPF0316 family)
MDSTVLCMSLGIMVARCADVALGTLRTLSIIQGRRAVAWALGFIEILIWIYAVSRVMQNLDQPLYAVAYAFGFGAGNYVGITLENWFAFGEQLVSIITQQGASVASMFRSEGFDVASLQIEEADGPLQLLCVESHRKATQHIAQLARQLDPECVYVINDIRTFSRPLTMTQQPTGWRSILKKK